MPTVTLNKTVFEKLVGKKLPLERLKDRISMLGTDLEKIEGDEILVEVFPNRPDMLSEQGFARAFSSFIGVKTGIREYTIKKSGYKVYVDPSCSMRPYTACAIVKNVKFTDEKIREIMQIQEKLAMTHGRNRIKSAYGVYPAKAIHFPVTYIAKDPTKIRFQPLGFEKPILASKVEELHPKGREYKHIAENWKKYPFFIDAKENILCMLPYTNSHDTGKVELDTTEVFIECTGVDLNNIMVALNIFVTLMADMGGEIYSIDMVYKDRKITTPDLTPKKMKFDLDYINKILGLDLSEKEAVTLLKRMGFGYEKNNVLIPAYRADILHQIDFAEDIAIAYGYENFEEIIPKVATVAEENKFKVFENKLAFLMVGLGLTETLSYNLIDREMQTGWMNLSIDPVSIVDPVSSEYNSLRFWIIPTLMQIFQKNKHHEYPQRIFEIGSVFKKDEKTETKTSEAIRLGVGLCGHDVDFTQIKQILDYIFRQLDLQYDLRETDHPSFIAGRVARGSVNGVDIAYVGEIHPEVLQKWDLQVPVCAFELNLTELFKIQKAKEKKSG